MNHDNEHEGENIAETLARVLPKGEIIHKQDADIDGRGAIHHILVPKGFELKAIDDEALLATPRRTKAHAEFADAASFIAYVNFHDQGTATSAVWCAFDPSTFALSFEAVIDEHDPDMAGWRGHRATFKPALSQEWKTWLGKNGKSQGQMTFAEFLESNEKDIAARDGFPNSADIMKMATAFEANADKRFKSKVRLQSGGVQMEYVNTDDEETVEKMRVFEKFLIGVPVFWTMPKADVPIQAWPIVARLKYAVKTGVVEFWYDLIRPDQVHEQAALAMIEQIRAGIGEVPLRLGTCK